MALFGGAKSLSRKKRTVLFSTVTQMCEILLHVTPHRLSWHTSRWNIVQFCCSQWKLCTRNLESSLIVAHRADDTSRPTVEISFCVDDLRGRCDGANSMSVYYLSIPPSLTL